MTQTKAPRDLYAEVTNTIIEALEAGTRPWVKPWTANGSTDLPLRSNGVPYRGINVLTLWLSGAARGFASPYWMTFRQAKELGGSVRKGERSTLVVYASKITKSETDDATGERTEKTIPFLKSYPVFNVCQIDGLPAHYYPAPVPVTTEGKDDYAEAYIRNTGADIRQQGSQPLYNPAGDFILCPPIGAFDCPLSFYETITHEIVHWTGHKSRLDRFATKRPGISEYAFEELIAEMGAAFLCSALGLTPAPREEQAAYIGEWLKALRSDKRMIFSAATKAQAAVDYLNSLQPGQVADDTDEDRIAA